MDIKIHGVTKDIMRQALRQARDARLHILEVMNRTMDKPRADISAHAPRIVTLKVRTEKIRDIIGPGGKVIRGIVEETGCKIDIEDDGTVFIASSEEAGMRRAIEIIEGITMEAQVGKVYKGIVRRIVDFGAFVEIMPGTDGLLHISQIGPGRVQRVSDVLKEGDEIPVKVLEIDRSGKIRLSRKEALETGAAGAPANSRPNS
jgi:polyribonucleotide nucleotidyltransferase